MEPLHNPNDRAPHHTSTYSPRRSRLPGLLGAGAIVAAVIGVTMWAQSDDARKAEAPLGKGAGATAPAQTGSDATNRSAAGTRNGSPGNDTTHPAPGADGQVATQPPPARQ
jgi:hypothetical protein